MMRVEVFPDREGWLLAEPLDREVYTPEVMAQVPWRDVVWAHADRRVIVSENSQILCHAGVFFRDGLYGGDKVRICGVGGVMTSPRARKRGLAGMAMTRAAELMQEENIDFGLLFCEEHNVRLYAALGWRLFSGKVHCIQPSGPMIFDVIPTMTLSINRTPRDGVIDLCGLPW